MTKVSRFKAAFDKTTQEQSLQDKTVIPSVRRTSSGRFHWLYQWKKICFDVSKLANNLNITLETHEEEEEEVEENFTSDTQQRHDNSWSALFLKVKSLSLELYCVRIHRSIRRFTFHTAAQLLVDVLGRVCDAGRGHSATAPRHTESVITAPESGDTTCGHRATGRWWVGPRPDTCYWRLIRPMRARLRSVGRDRAQSPTRRRRKKVTPTDLPPGAHERWSSRWFLCYYAISNYLEPFGFIEVLTYSTLGIVCFLKKYNKITTNLPFEDCLQTSCFCAIPH